MDLDEGDEAAAANAQTLAVGEIVADGVPRHVRWRRPDDCPRNDLAVFAGFRKVRRRADALGHIGEPIYKATFPAPC